MGRTSDNGFRNTIAHRADNFRPYMMDHWLNNYHLLEGGKVVTHQSKAGRPIRETFPVWDGEL